VKVNIDWHVFFTYTVFGDFSVKLCDNNL